MSNFDTSSQVRARKLHRCCECKGAINPGDTYEKVFVVQDGDRKYSFRAYRLVVLMDKRRMAYANAYNAETVKIRDSLAQGVSA